MRKPTFIIMVLGIAAASFLLGSLYGFKQGITSFAYLDQLPKGAISTYLYKRADAGDIESIKRNFNIDVDFALDAYVNYLSEGSPLYSRIFLAEHVQSTDEYLGKLAAFRMRVPELDVSYGLNDIEKAEYAERLMKRSALLAKHGYSLGNRPNHSFKADAAPTAQKSPAGSARP